MSINFDDITDMSVSEIIKVLDEKRKMADLKREEIKKLRSAIESTKINKTYIFEEVSEEEVEKLDSSFDEDFEKEVDYYLNEFLNLKDYSKEKIIDVLPSINNYNYKRIILRIMASITRDIRDIKEIIITDSSNMQKSELKEYKDEIVSLTNKRNTLKEILYSFDLDDVVIKSKQNKLIFMPIKSDGKIRVLEEVDDIPQEFYEGFLDLFESIKNGTFKNIRRFVNNEGLNGALEVKGYQVRVLFQRLSKDCYAIISMFIKKTQNDRGYRNGLQNKYAEYKDMEKKIKEKIKDSEFIKKNEEYERELFTILSSNKEDIKGGSK